VKLAALSMAGGQLTIRLAEPASERAVAALKALGVTPVAPALTSAPPEPAALADAPAVVAPQDFQMGASACR
jgi:hypothetical protein